MPNECRTCLHEQSNHQVLVGACIQMIVTGPDSYGWCQCKQFASSVPKVLAVVTVTQLFMIPRCVCDHSKSDHFTGFHELHCSCKDYQPSVRVRFPRRVDV